MRLESAQRAITSSGTMETAKATIKASPKIFDMFADQTYANKPVAICRELVANGVDAHIAAGTPERPVEITMPTEMEPEFKVRDYGIGMSHEFVMGPFMAYTDGSTKDGSDEMIGGFGIGSKSPFAYTDQFTLRVVHEGILSVYTMFKDSEGIPSIGLQAQTSTDEHNGVEVTFPVEQEDMDDFRAAAQTALQYFQPLPIVHHGELNAPDYAVVGESGKWALRSEAGDLAVIMGGVRYPVKSESLPFSVRNDSKVSPLLNYGIDLFVPLGTVAVAMSREDLSYTTKTSEGLTNAINAVIDEVAETFAHMFDEAPSLWDAMAMLAKELSMAGSSYRNSRRAFMESHAKYKGQPLETSLYLAQRWGAGARNYIEVPGDAWQIRSTTWRRKQFPLAKWERTNALNTISPGILEAVFVDDLPIGPTSRYRSRIMTYMEEKGHNRDAPSLVLRAPVNTDKKQIKAMLDKIGNPSKVIFTSTLPEPPKAVRVKGAPNARPKVRMWKFDGKKDHWNNTIMNLTPSWQKRDHVVEIPYADQPTKGILYVMDNFSIVADYKKLNAGIVPWDDVLFVNKSDADKLKGFTPFADEYDKRFKKIQRQYPLMGQWLAVEQDSNLSYYFSEIANLIKTLGGINLTTTKKNTPFGKMVQLYEENVVPLTDEIRKYARAESNLRLPKRLDTAKLVAAFREKQADAQILIDELRFDRKAHAELFLRNL